MCINACFNIYMVCPITRSCSDRTKGNGLKLMET